MLFHSLYPPVPSIVDSIDTYSFLFHHFPPDRPDPRGTGVPLVIDDETGQRWTFEEFRERVDALAVGLRDEMGVGWDTTVALCCPNAVDFLTAVWAVHRCGGIVSTANPSYCANELAYQLKEAKAELLIVGDGENQRRVGLEAAASVSLPSHRVLVLQQPRSFQSATSVNGASSLPANGATNGVGNSKAIGPPCSQGDQLRTLTSLIEAGRASLAEAQTKGGDKARTQLLEKGRAELTSGQARTKLAFLSFSSGTTGLSKAVAIPHFSLVANTLQMMVFNGVRNTTNHCDAPKDSRFLPGQDVSLGALPFYHIYGLIVGCHFTFYAAVANAVIPRYAFEPMLESIIRHRISVLWLVPPQIIHFCKNPATERLRDELRQVIRIVTVGAAPLTDDQAKTFANIFPEAEFGQAYGLTETATCALMFPHEVRPSIAGSAGRLISSCVAKVVRRDGSLCGFDEPGELCVRSPSNSLGYPYNDQATKDAFDEDGFVHTGDEVVINKAGDVFVIDRLKELIKVKGFSVAPAELEGFLLEHPAVADSGVVPVKDEARGEAPLAFVKLTPEYEKRVREAGPQEAQCLADDIVDFVAQNKVRYKHLTGGVEFVQAIPKTPSGKILRRLLREEAKRVVQNRTKV